MDESIAFGFPIGHVLCDFTTQYVTKSRKRIIHGFVVNCFIQILDKNIANSRSTQTGITLTPHDTDWFTLQNVKIHSVKGSFSVSRLLEVDISISQRHPGDHVPANPNG